MNENILNKVKECVLARKEILAKEEALDFNQLKSIIVFIKACQKRLKLGYELKKLVEEANL